MESPTSSLTPNGSVPGQRKSIGERLRRTQRSNLPAPGLRFVLACLHALPGENPG